MKTDSDGVIDSENHHINTKTLIEITIVCRDK
jgi:hypothetical protein